MSEESTEWCVTVRWPYAPAEEENYGLQWHLSHPDMFYKAISDLFPVTVESFEVRARTACLVATVTVRTARPRYDGDRTRFRSSAQGAVDLAVDAACHAAALCRLIKLGAGLPEPVRFEVRSASRAGTPR